jgi:hypothetical protein
MADIHDCAVIAAAGIAIDQKVTATLRPHMAQSHWFELSNFDRRHASQSAPSSAFRQEPPRDAKRASRRMKRLRIRRSACPCARLIGRAYNARRFNSLNLAFVSAMTIPQRRLSNDPGQFVAAIDQVRDKGE